MDRLAAVLPFEPRSSPGRASGRNTSATRCSTGRRSRAARRRGPRWASRRDERVLGLFPGQPRPGDRPALAAVPGGGAHGCSRQGRCDRVVVAGTEEGGYPGAEGFLLHRGAPELVFASADAALAKSGTTTLEAALADVPMVVAYRVHPLTSWLARRLITVPWISLVNLVAGRRWWTS